MDALVKLNTLLKNPIAVVLLCIIAVIYLFFSLVWPNIKFKHNASSPVVSQEEVVDQSSSEIVAQTVETTESNDSGVNKQSKLSAWKRYTKRDPFFSIDSTEQIDISNEYISNEQFEKKTYSINAISIGNEKKSVLIGDFLLSEGDTFPLGIILQIENDSVVILTGQNRRTLYFYHRFGSLR